MSSTSQLIDFLREIGKLKNIERRGWVLRDIHRPETISGHMYRMSIIPLLCLQSVNTISMDRVIKLCLVHDIAECIVGDITPLDNVSKTEKRQREVAAIKSLGEMLPQAQAEILMTLFMEYEDQETPEAQLTKDLDRFDMVLQAFEYEKAEYEKNGKLPDLEEFFNFERNINTIQNEQVKSMVAEITEQRKNFLAMIKLSS